MKTDSLARHYDTLTPEERFRLILAASERGDEAERERFVQSAPRMTLSMSEHSSYGYAFWELALITFIDLLEEATRYLEAIADIEKAGASKKGTTKKRSTAKSANNDAGERATRDHLLEAALAAGFLLQTKAAGWKRFCEQMQVPLFLLWESLPGFKRLQRALALAENIAFSSEEFLGWLNHLRPATEPEFTALSPTDVDIAADLTEAFHHRVKTWGGSR